MTQPTAVYSVYDASGTTGVGKGNREDLAAFVSDISPTETPILSALEKTTASAVYHEWTTHALATAAANEKVEGDDDAINAAVAKTRFGNRCAISNKVTGVTKTQIKVGKTGMKDAEAEEVMYKLKEIKRDQEVMLHANTAAASGSDSVARKSAGFPTWIITTADAIGAAPTGNGTDTATDGAQRAFSEAQVLAVSQLCYTAGGKPTILNVGAYNKRVASGFAGNQTRHVTASEKELINSIKVYEDDFNTLKIVPNRFTVARNAELWDVDQAKIAELRPIDVWDLAVVGSTKRKQIEVEWCLEMTNPRAHGIIRDLTTS